MSASTTIAQTSKSIASVSAIAADASPPADLLLMLTEEYYHFCQYLIPAFSVSFEKDKAITIRPIGSVSKETFDVIYNYTGAYLFSPRVVVGVSEPFRINDSHLVDLGYFGSTQFSFMKVNIAYKQGQRSPTMLREYRAMFRFYQRNRPISKDRETKERTKLLDHPQFLRMRQLQSLWRVSNSGMTKN